ncbi:MAG: DUF1642 domain-containing protein [Streptococcaceae bacterium]|jgi:hypothetical protein|nr:DUF1642 domain-containing protein [Streptococcaceae bacterium]
MVELTKEVLIEVLKSHYERLKNDKGKYIEGVKNGIDFAIIKANQLTATPSKPVVPTCTDKFIKGGRALGASNLEIIANAFRFVDKKPDNDFSKYLKKNSDEFINAVVNGYEVEQPKRWVVVKSEEYFIEFKSHVTDGVPYHSLNGANKDYAYEFTDKRKAELVAELIGGEVEEV